VDRISTRRLLWEALRDRAALLVDGRMSGEVIRVLASAAPLVDAHYATTLFEQADAYAGACTARSTIYAASIAAGLMVGQFAKWLRGLPVDADVTLNLLATELTVGSQPNV
jgi:sulfur carrier protein ThiS adenylyltransferase